jgi:hypothetical protein
MEEHRGVGVKREKCGKGGKKLHFLCFGLYPSSVGCFF